MNSIQSHKICRRMLLIIPAMILFIIGDYCMGLEPAGSQNVSGMISTGWTSIADWRFAVSNIGGMLGTALYALAAFAFVDYLRAKRAVCRNSRDRFWLWVYTAGLLCGVMVFLYFHLACGTLIHSYNVIADAAQGNTGSAVQIWQRVYIVQAVPFWTTFIVMCLTSTGGWFAVVLRGILPLRKIWVLAAPIAVAGIGFLLETLIPFPFHGFASGFESAGWIIMFLGGIKAVRVDCGALQSA